MRKNTFNTIILFFLILIILLSSNSSISLQNFTTIEEKTITIQNLLKDERNTTFFEIKNGQYPLYINQPIISYNSSHLLITNLTITFLNGTNIASAPADDNVTIFISNSAGFLQNMTLEYDSDRFNGWGGITDTSDYKPRTYYIDLLAITNDYYFFDTIYSFKKYFEIVIRYINLSFNDVNLSIYAFCSITTQPYTYREYILLLNSRIFACIFNSTNHLKKILDMTHGGFNGFDYTFFTENVNISEFAKGNYYCTIIVVYDEELFISEPSQTLVVGEEEATTTTDFGVELIVLPTIIIAYAVSNKIHRKKK